MKKFELNYSNSEYQERHKGELSNEPKQTPIEWKQWDELYDFFRGYFNHFGDDVSALEKETFERMVKTIWRIASVHATYRTRKECKEEKQQTFSEQLAAWANAIKEHNEVIENETDKCDLIRPSDLWKMVMKSRKNK